MRNLEPTGGTGSLLPFAPAAGVEEVKVDHSEDGEQGGRDYGQPRKPGPEDHQREIELVTCQHDAEEGAGRDEGPRDPARRPEQQEAPARKACQDGPGEQRPAARDDDARPEHSGDEEEDRWDPRNQGQVGLHNASRNSV